MKTMNIVSDSFSAHLQTVESTREALSEQVNLVGKILADCIKNDGTLFLCGNGGSAADSQHIAAELIGRFKKNRRALRSIALSTDTSVLTCVANDFSYDDIFSRQIEGLGRKGDVLVAISTSGNSENINRAIKQAKELDVMTIALLGKGGGATKDVADHVLIVPSDSTARIQEMHILIGHIFCELIERELGLD